MSPRKPLNRVRSCVDCLAWGDLPLTQNDIQNVRAKLKRLASRGILVETEPGLFTQPRRWPDRRASDQST
ncbi:hypothetical protein ACTWPT_55870 [Nonomuraea sp. 3N208]|uniref:hypothetical protein n=1 Tax=Nonomuraea sp. 3N208 TaxID=3457421 RepID=UPI003FD1B90D